MYIIISSGFGYVSGIHFYFVLGLLFCEKSFENEYDVCPKYGLKMYCKSEVMFI